MKVFIFMDSSNTRPTVEHHVVPPGDFEELWKRGHRDEHRRPPQVSSCVNRSCRDDRMKTFDLNQVHKGVGGSFR